MTTAIEISMYKRKQIRAEFLLNPSEFICLSSQTFMKLWWEPEYVEEIRTQAAKFLSETNNSRWKTLPRGAGLFYERYHLKASEMDRVSIRKQFLTWWCKQK